MKYNWFENEDSVLLVHGLVKDHEHWISSLPDLWEDIENIYDYLE